jgi:hypothetical protein
LPSFATAVPVTRLWSVVLRPALGHDGSITGLVHAGLSETDSQ